MKKANFHQVSQVSLSHLNQGSYVRSSVIRQSECLSGFLKERGELRLSPFSVEEEERIANPRPRTQTEQILTLCAGGKYGLREAIADSRHVYSC